MQFQAYKAEQSDANQEKAQTEVNQMFADQARVLWNSAVNIAEGTINTALDAASTNGGTNPLPLLNPNRPQVNFSGAKTDYRSEMMRRDLNGKLDGDGIKAGQFIETGVTIAAPVIVGAATTPKAAPQSLKSLGGLPKATTVTQTTVVKPISELFNNNRIPKASEIKNWAESQGWKLKQNPNGPPKYVDENNVVRITIKKGSSRAPGSGSPHVEIRNATGQRIDASGNPIARKSVDNHTFINYDL